MKVPRIKKKFVAIGLASGLAMGAAGIAAAYFSSTGTGKGSAKVGSATHLTVSQTSTNGTTYLYPDGTTTTLTFTITNPGKGTQHYVVTASDASIATAGTVKGLAVTYGSTAAIPGCKSTWFSATANPESGNLTTGGTTTDTVVVSMNNGTGPTGSTQNTCSGHSPKVLLHVTG